MLQSFLVATRFIIRQIFYLLREPESERKGIITVGWIERGNQELLNNEGKLEADHGSATAVSR